MVDPVVNKGQVTVSIGYDAAATSIVLASGDGAKLPDPVVDGPYNLSWWDSTKYANPIKDPNFEIVRVTGPTGTGDTKTITRAQESTAASAKNTVASTYEMILGVTAKTINDLDTEKSKIANITDMEDQSFVNLLENGDFESWSAGASATPDGWVYSQGGAGGSIARVADTKIATYVSRITKSDAGDSYIHQLLSKYLRYRSRTVTFGCWVKSANTVTDKVFIQIQDGVNTNEKYYQNSGNWEWLTTTLDVNVAATQLKPHSLIKTGANSTADFVGAILVEGSICPAFGPKPLEDDGKTIQIDSDNNKITSMKQVYVPSSDTSITAAGGITITNTIMKVVGSGGAIDITADPQIVAGTNGQIVVIQGTHDTNTVKLDDGTGLALSASITLATQDNITLMYDSGDSEWIEISRTTVT